MAKPNGQQTAPPYKRVKTKKLADDGEEARIIHKGKPKGRRGKGEWKHYNDDFVQGALLLLRANGWPSRTGAIMQTSRMLGVNHNTLSMWANGKRRAEHGTFTRDELKAELIPLFFEGAKGLAASAISDMDDMTPYQRMISAGIATDKLIALAGIPSQTVDVRVLGVIEHAVTAWGTDEGVEAEIINATVEEGK